MTYNTVNEAGEEFPNDGIDAAIIGTASDGRFDFLRDGPDRIEVETTIERPATIEEVAGALPNGSIIELTSNQLEGLRGQTIVIDSGRKAEHAQAEVKKAFDAGREKGYADEQPHAMLMRRLDPILARLFPSLTAAQRKVVAVELNGHCKNIARMADAFGPDPIREKALAMAISAGGGANEILSAAARFEKFLRGEAT